MESREETVKKVQTEKLSQISLAPTPQRGGPLTCVAPRPEPRGPRVPKLGRLTCAATAEQRPGLLHRPPPAERASSVGCRYPLRPVLHHGRATWKRPRNTRLGALLLAPGRSGSGCSAPGCGQRFGRGRQLLVQLSGSSTGRRHVRVSASPLRPFGRLRKLSGAASARSEVAPRTSLGLSNADPFASWKWFLPSLRLFSKPPGPATRLLGYFRKPQLLSVSSFHSSALSGNPS